jgi:hypothetical protein
MRIERVARRDCWSLKLMNFVVDLANLESLVVRTTSETHARSKAPIKRRGGERARAHKGVKKGGL